MKEGWKRHKLNELADMRLGKMLDQNKNKGEFYDYLANVNVQWGEIILDNLKQMKFESSEFDRYGLNVGDIVMCEGGEPGRCSIWKGQRKVMMIQKALHRIRAKSEVNSYFLYYYLFYRGKSGYFEGYFTGSTIKHFTGESLAKVEIDIPPIQTQRKIASILSGYDDLIENNLKRIKILEEMAQQTYEEWFVRMRFPGYDSAVMNEETGLPEGWEKVKLGEYLNFKKGKKVEEICGSKEIGTEKVLLLDSLESGKFNFTKIGKHELVKRGDILMLMDGARSSYVFQADNGIIGSTLAKVDLKKIPSSFMFYYFQNNLEWLQINNTGAAIPHANPKFIKSINFKLPKEKILMLWEDFANPIIDNIWNLKDQNQRLREARDLLLPRLMMGIVEV
ncbi:restriction endonuclease subunit S [Kaistella yonginensis]|uniref:restriction endonuclease subunit S n=1 Tax=Kaistella yonginensis TaxID=658267 RepID=UPI0025B5F8BB|nr:restriction endonuclease subunit S [Kaistella yonginensis]MDN3606784.1 restriction endonuclease subunit S [Kaistella yonginensis]